MIQEWVPSFLDEMTKVAAAALTKKEKRRQAVEFGILGALSGPAVGSTVNLIQKGRMLPEGVKSVPRWLAGSMAGGALLSGAIPVVRHALERSTQLKANDRVRRRRMRLERLGQAG